MSKIASITARQILDSRGYPTVEADVHLEDGNLGRASAPSGKSTGKHEACELRDMNPKDYQGLSVHKAVGNVGKTIAPALVGRDASDQTHVDEIMIELDGTPNKSKLGANAILAVSLACAAAAAKSENQELFQYLSRFSPRTGDFQMPHGMFNIINGGVHAPETSDFQEYMIIPKNSDKFAEQLRAASEIFHCLGKLLQKKNLTTTVGDEGGYAPKVSSNVEAFDLITEAIHEAGFVPGKEIFLGIDVASTQFYTDGKYSLARDGQLLDADGMIAYFKNLVSKYPLMSIEDPLQEEDFEGFAKFTKTVGVQVVGDDLYTTNSKRLAKGIELNSTDAILIKPNQIGTLTETIATIKEAYDHNMKVVISHRSGDTADTFIADLAVACRAEFVKFGSLSRSERLSKYDRLLQIEEQLI